MRLLILVNICCSLHLWKKKQIRLTKESKESGEILTKQKRKLENSAYLETNLKFCVISNILKNLGIWGVEILVYICHSSWCKYQSTRFQIGLKEFDTWLIIIACVNYSYVDRSWRQTQRVWKPLHSLKGVTRRILITR